MGPGGAALIVQTTIDRKLGRMCKEIADLRKLIEKRGGKTATENSIAYMFEAKGAVVVTHSQEQAAETFAEADPEEIAIEVGAEDVATVQHDSGVTEHTFYCDPAELATVAKELQEQGWNWSSAGVGLASEMKTPLSPDDYGALEGLLDALYESDDVSDIYHNAEADDS